MEKNMKKLLSIKNLNKSYHTKKGIVIANRNLSFSVSSGEVTILLGHNGAGKTTMLNQIIGMVRPDSGEINYGTKSLLENPFYARTLISLMPQLQTPLVGVSIAEAVCSIASLRVGKKVTKKEIFPLLNSLGIDKLADRKGESLSGGLKRITAFCMAVVCPPQIILLDEPTNDVDPERRILIWKYIRKMADKGHLVFVVTHNLLEAQQYADRFLIFNQGELVMDRKVDDKQVVEEYEITLNTEEEEKFKKDISILENGITKFNVKSSELTNFLSWLQDKEIRNLSIRPVSLENIYSKVVR